MKKNTVILTLALLLATAAKAQIFVMEEDNNPNRPSGTEINGEYGNIIYHGTDEDQPNWVPIGGELLLLTAMGGAYLLAKHKKKTNK